MFQIFAKRIKQTRTRPSQARALVSQPNADESMAAPLNSQRRMEALMAKAAAQVSARSMNGAGAKPYRGSATGSMRGGAGYEACPTG